MILLTPCKMLVNWIFWLLVPGWKDLILNPLTGKISQKNLFGVMGFYVGTVVICTVALTQLARGQHPDMGTLSLLTINGLGLAALKIWQGQENRKTATDAGQPLTEPGSNPPEPMPQVENPNAPTNGQGPLPE